MPAHDPPYLTFLDVLDDEDRALAGLEETPADPLRDAYADARQADPTGDHSQQEKAFRTALFRRLHQRRRTALCFSGGGIRSATFGLGILQGLAAFSRSERGSRPSLLGEFDFLSTVSGGGYLGCWFSAWATRLSRDNAQRIRECDMPDAFDGPAAVMAALSRSPDSTFEPEPEPIRHLREYTNYLVPRTGLFSADTWALVGTVVRNILLNWMVLLPLVAVVVLAPSFAEELSRVKPGDVPAATLEFLLISAIALAALASAYIGYDLPSAGNGRLGSKGFLFLSLAPLSIAAIHLNLFWAWLPEGDASRPFWDVLGRGKAGLTLMHFGLLGVLMHGGGMLSGLAISWIMFRRPRPSVSVSAIAAAALTGFVAGAIGMAASRIPDERAGILINCKLYAALAFPTVLGVFLGAGILLAGLTSYVTEDEDREWWARAGGLYMLAALSWLAFACIGLYAAEALRSVGAELKAAVLACTAATGWGTARLGAAADTFGGRRESAERLAQDKPAGKVKEFAARLILPIFLTFLLMVLATTNEWLLDGFNHLPMFVNSHWPTALRTLGDATAHQIWLLLLYVIVSLSASWFINVNKFSLHGMYRQRLIRAYLGASNVSRNPNRFTGFDQNDNLPMCSLTRSKPLHVVNMTLNLVRGKDLAWQERKGASFTASRLHAGSCRVGYRNSRFYGGRYKDDDKRLPITLGTAMTISGAAASPNMGYHSSGLLTFVMTLFNARLGWWLGNPRAEASVWKLPGPRLGIRPFIDELLGLTDADNAWIYLSDGGHFENLGLYEMVLRRCNLVLVSDAGADPKYSYEDLANAVRKVRIDLGIPIEFDAAYMPGPSGIHANGGPHCAIGWIHYEAVDPGAEPGMLIYIKASMNGNEPPDVRQYAALDSRFPHQPTSDQFFDESQFESYRRLGLHIIEEICGGEGNEERTLDLDQFRSAVTNYVSRWKGTAQI